MYDNPGERFAAFRPPGPRGRLRLALAAPAALAQTWPAKQIRIIVPYTPGGSSDIIARAIQQPLQDALKQTVIVENKPGANGNTGTDFVAKSPPDGYTILLCDVGALAITSSVYTKLPFDPAKDLVGITMLAYSPNLLVVHPSVALATKSLPVLPLAPGLFSTMTVCFSASDSGWLMARAMMSDEPPGGMVTTIFTGLEGYCADATPAKKIQRSGSSRIMGIVSW